MALKPLTPELRRQFEELATLTRGMLDRIFVPAEALSIVSAIGRSQVPMAIPGLVLYAFAAPGPLRRAAREAIDQLIRSVAPLDLPAFDQRMRSATERYDQPWFELKPSEVSKIAAGEQAATMLGVVSSHHNGRVREVAVNQLAAMCGGSELGFLLVRLNDWVEPVRKRAASAVTERVCKENAKLLVLFLPLILRLETWSRGVHASIVDAILRMLGSRECEPALRDGLKSPDRYLVRACLRVAAGMEESGTPLLETVLQNVDASARYRAAQQLLRRVSDERLPELCTVLKRDRSMPLRRLALQAVAERTPALARNSLLGALLDRHASIRDFAQFQLRDCAAFELRAYYLETIASGAEADRAIALRGLGETGTSSDLEIVRPFLRETAVSLRKSAIVAAARLAPAEVMTELLSALGDDSPAISRIAVRALIPHAQVISSDRLMAMLKSDRPPHVRRNGLCLALRGGKCNRLIAALFSYADTDEKVANMAREEVGSWRWHYSAEPPSSIEVDAISDALAKAKSYVSTRSYEFLRSLIAAWRQR